LIVTELAVQEPSEAGLALKELARGVDIGAVQRAIDARLIIPS
jgi:acyl CoA:acetate/3-ketoacid CoA transferase beta subunit